MGISKLKRSLHSKEKTREAIKELIWKLYRQIDDLHELYRAMTGECFGCTPEAKCWECKEEARRAAEKEGASP